jgi:hypothetical protein
LQIPAQPELEVAIGRLQREAAAASGHSWRRLGAFGGGLVIDLELSTDDPDLLVQLVEPVSKGLERQGGGCAPPGRVGARGGARFRVRQGGQRGHWWRSGRSTHRGELLFELAHARGKRGEPRLIGG